MTTIKGNSLLCYHGNNGYANTPQHCPSCLYIPCTHASSLKDVNHVSADAVNNTWFSKSLCATCTRAHHNLLLYLYKFLLTDIPVIYPLWIWRNACISRNYYRHIIYTIINKSCSSHNWWKYLKAILLLSLSEEKITIMFLRCATKTMIKLMRNLLWKKKNSSDQGKETSFVVIHYLSTHCYYTIN